VSRPLIHALFFVRCSVGRCAGGEAYYRTFQNVAVAQRKKRAPYRFLAVQRESQPAFMNAFDVPDAGNALLKRHCNRERLRLHPAADRVLWAVGV
jgi:hypothetical protein